MNYKPFDYVKWEKTVKSFISILKMKGKYSLTEFREYCNKFHITNNAPYYFLEIGLATKNRRGKSVYYTITPYAESINVNDPAEMRKCLESIKIAQKNSRLRTKGKKEIPEDVISFINRYAIPTLDEPEYLMSQYGINQTWQRIIKSTGVIQKNPNEGRWYIPDMKDAVGRLGSEALNHNKPKAIKKVNLNGEDVVSAILNELPKLFADVVLTIQKNHNESMTVKREFIDFIKEVWK